MPSPEKFRETLDDFKIGQNIIDEMYQGFDGIVSKTNKMIKSAFFRQALDVMNEKLPPKQVQEILEANACCKSGARDKASKEFARINAEKAIEERLELISESQFLTRFSLFQKSPFSLSLISSRPDNCTLIIPS